MKAQQICSNHVVQGQPWKAALAGHEIDPLQAESEQQRLLLERFQEEVTHSICHLIHLPVLSCLSGPGACSVKAHELFCCAAPRL